MTQGKGDLCCSGNELCHAPLTLGYIDHDRLFTAIQITVLLYDIYFISIDRPVYDLIHFIWFWVYMAVLLLHINAFIGPMHWIRCDSDARVTVN